MHQFTVSEARTAIACPRIFYFDERRFRGGAARSKRVTQIWTTADAVITGCGKLFHDTIERFNRLAADAAEVRRALDQAAAVAGADARAEKIWQEFKRFIVARCLNRPVLNGKEPPQQQAFVRAVDQYVRELAHVLGYAVGQGRDVPGLVHEFFGDNRKRVDVTFYVGPHNEPVRVRGGLDYIYFDYRRGSNRIIDFKLMPAEATSKDLLQAALYGLMHHQQHGTQPDIAIFYLHPERKMVEENWAALHAARGKVFDLLASMVAWAEYDEAAHRGCKPPGEPALCHACPWDKRGQCQQRLGPKTDGARVNTWSAALAGGAAEPQTARREPPEPPPECQYDDGTDAEPEPAEPPAQPPRESVSKNHRPLTPDPSPARGEGRIRTGSQPPAVPDAAGLFLGSTIAGGRRVHMPVAALPTHLSVVGAAGSGKSWLAKVVAEEAIAQGIPVLAVDPQGDLVQFLRPSVLPADATDAQRAAQAAFRRRVEVRVWTPGTSHAQRLCLSPMRLPKPADLQGFDNPQRRQEEWEAMLGVAAGNLVQLAQAGGDAEAQKTFVLEILRKLAGPDSAPGALRLEDIIAAMAAPEDLGLDDPVQMISRRDRDKLRQRLFSRARGPSAALFSGGMPLDLERFVQPLEPGRVPLNVVYLNALAGDGQKQYFVAALAAEIYRWMITSAAAGNVRLLVFLDEARDFAPAGTSKPPAKEPLLRLFAQGRKFGVSCLICTQSPRSVDYQLFSNVSTKLIGRLEAAQDVQRVAQWFQEADGPPGWLSGRTGADKGSMIGRWPGMAAELDGVEFRSRWLYSLHEGAWPPDRVEAEWAQSPLAGRLAGG